MTSKSDQEFKADAGKEDPTLFDEGFPLARAFMQATLDYGAIKYAAHSWRIVPNAFQRYAQAGARHRQKRLLSQMRNGVDGFLDYDNESGLPHVAHELFNLMAQIELYLQDRPYLDLSAILKFKQPPQDHKVGPKVGNLEEVVRRHCKIIPQTHDARVQDAMSDTDWNNKGA